MFSLSPTNSDQYFQEANQESSASMSNLSLGNSLGHAIRTNTISGSSNFRGAGNELNTPLLVPLTTNEPLYTGL
jgi:hypothetical protein